MKRTFILFSCLLSIALLQAESLSAGCCGGKRKHNLEKHFAQDIHFDGCGCGGGGAGGSNEIPSDNS